MICLICAKDLDRIDCREVCTECQKYIDAEYALINRELLMAPLKPKENK